MTVFCFKCIVCIVRSLTLQMRIQVKKLVLRVKKFSTKYLEDFEKQCKDEVESTKKTGESADKEKLYRMKKEW